MALIDKYIQNKANAQIESVGSEFIKLIKHIDEQIEIITANQVEQEAQFKKILMELEEIKRIIWKTKIKYICVGLLEYYT